MTAAGPAENEGRADDRRAHADNVAARSAADNRQAHARRPRCLGRRRSFGRSGDEASAALKLRPDWSYLRENLLPQIEQRLRLER